MEHGSFRVSAPGSVMLMGEHAVLKGSRCICAAVDKRLSIECRPLAKRRIEIESALGNYSAPLDKLPIKKPFEFVLEALKTFSGDFETGVHLKIESEIPPDVGFGSSAAVAVATVAAARRLGGRDCGEQLIVDQATTLVRRIQGRASGADCAASAHGGVLGYRMDPLELSPIRKRFPLTLIYSGYKRKTAEVIELVEGYRREFSEGFIKLNELVHAAVSEALNAIEAEDWERLGFLLNFNQGLMEAMGVGNADLAEIVHALRADPKIHGAKISGSGLGDCVLGLGHASKDCAPTYRRFELEVAEEGVRFD